MSVRKRRGQYYTDNSAEIEPVVRNWSNSSYPATAFMVATCDRGHHQFYLETDEDEGVARRTCIECGTAHFIGDSEDFAAGANLSRHECLCGNEALEISVGVALYDGSKDVRWTYIGCRCPKCKLTGVYADWKSEAGDVEEFLERV